MRIDYARLFYPGFQLESSFQFTTEQKHNRNNTKKNKAVNRGEKTLPALILPSRERYGVPPYGVHE